MTMADTGKIRKDAAEIIKRVINDNLPQRAVRNALVNHAFNGRVYLLAVGKAAWTMAKAASDILADRLERGIVITKYGHSQGELPRIEITEAGHPITDANSINGSEKAITLAKSLQAGDELLFLVSGGGSALFEKPRVSLAELAAINEKLLASGADIVEINMIRKRLSEVKAGRFAKICEPAHVFTVVLSDVLGDRLDTIASGPTVPDLSTSEDALSVAEKYKLNLTPLQMKYLTEETPKEISNSRTVVTGSVRTLCESAAKAAYALGYAPYILTTSMRCEAREAGSLLGSIAADTPSGFTHFTKPCALIAGGETVVRLKGNGSGGRNQELALSAAKAIDGCAGTLIFSLGSDGTDGPTDAAGGIVDGGTAAKLRAAGLSVDGILADNDSYNGLKAVDGLIITGPTGTNVNDVAVALCR
jgi:hydroxypyruvate reductase